MNAILHHTVSRTIKNIHKKADSTAKLGHAKVKNELIASREQGHDCVCGEEPRVTASDRILNLLVIGNIGEAKLAKKDGRDLPVQEKGKTKAENASGTEWKSNGKENADVEKPVHCAEKQEDITNR
jgi:hypothetical protein